MLFNLSKQIVLAEHVEIAASFWPRLMGLMGRAGLEDGSALVLKPCNSVHTCFMRFKIDVLFLSGGLQVLHLEPSMLPYRFSKFVKGAVQVIELPAGTIAKTGTKTWDQLELR